MERCEKCGGAWISTVYDPKTNTLIKTCSCCRYFWSESVLGGKFGTASRFVETNTGK